MQTQVKQLDFTGQKIYVGMDTHKNSWKISSFGIFGLRASPERMPNA
ncbi:MAG: hypothetical protein R6W78_13865 [Bacteroidales bacterium]